MITLKTGVPGSGKTLSMVAELLAESKSKEPRPLYTNITDLALPHIPLRNWEPGTKREDGVLYTIDWRQCPVGSMIVIDEAFMYGYEGKSAQSAVPDYIRDLAVHRKDYSVDIWFIAQGPKLLHVAARRQVGKHQHYRRLFGSGRAVVYEWDQCQDNLAATKTAVMSQFSYPKSVFKAYKSAEVHTKPKFKLPWFVWIPVLLVPLAAWAVPKAYTTLHGSMTGKGIEHSVPALSAPSVPTPAAPNVPVPAGAPPGFIPQGSNLPQGTNPLAFPPVAPPAPALPRAYSLAGSVTGCISSATACKCFDQQNALVTVDAEVCRGMSRSVGSVAVAQLSGR